MTNSIKKFLTLGLIFVFSLIAVTVFSMFNSNSYAEELDTSYDSQTSIIYNTLDKYDNENEIANELSTHNIELIEIKQYSDDGLTPYHLNPSDFVYSLVTAKDKLTGNLIITAKIDPKINELFSGPLDYVSIEWNPSKATYVASTGDNEIITVADASKSRDNGIVVFNFEDNRIFGWTKTYCSVILKNVKNDFMCGSKFIHTYVDWGFSFSCNINLLPAIEVSSSSIKVESALTLGITATSNVKSWQRWIDTTIISMEAL